MIQDVLLPDQLADDQEFLIGVAPSSQKAGAKAGHGVDAGQIALEMAKLLLDCFVDLIDSGAFLLLLRRSLRLGPQQETVAWLVYGVCVACGQKIL